MIKDVEKNVKEYLMGMFLYLRSGHRADLAKIQGGIYAKQVKSCINLSLLHWWMVYCTGLDAGELVLVCACNFLMWSYGHIGMLCMYMYFETTGSYLKIPGQIQSKVCSTYFVHKSHGKMKFNPCLTYCRIKHAMCVLFA